jgi:hypothetical protein
MKLHPPFWVNILILAILAVGCDEKSSAGLSDLGLEVDSARTIEPDATALDTRIVDTPDALVEMDVRSAPELEVVLISPAQDELLPLSGPIIIRGRVGLTPGDLAFVSTELTLDGATDLSIQLDPSGGFETQIASLQGGEHVITLTARLYPDIVKTTSVNFTVDCSYVENFDETLPTETWKLYGDELGLVGTWLELTNNRINTASAMVLTGFPIRPNALDMTFDISTGKCTTPGPCNIDRINAGGGLAVSIWAVSEPQFEDVWANRMGHFLLHPEKLSRSGFERPDSFHIEFDTYSNHCRAACGFDEYDGCTNPMTDPSPNNHISLLFNGHAALNGDPDPVNFNYCHLPELDASFDPFWSDYPNLDDNEWHAVRIVIDGIRVRVWMGQIEDTDVPLIDTDVPGLVFKGGLLSLSSGSGVNGNYHRIDNLMIQSSCSL